MILIHYTPDGLQRTVDLRGIYHGSTAILVGGAPSLKEQPYKLLEQRGVLTMAINNAGLLIRPTMLISGDHPNCFDPTLLLDPTIMKIGSIMWAEVVPTLYVKDRKVRSFPNTYFYIPMEKVPWDEYLADTPAVPWYHNTLMTSIHVLYSMGIRRIILAGSDFMSGKDSDYAHGQTLGGLEKKWNLDLYNHLVKELRLLKPLFDKSGLEFIDSSKNSRLSQVYKHVKLEEAIDMALEGFPKSAVEANALPHCSKYASRDIKEKIAEWPGHKIVHTATPVSEREAFKHRVETQDLQLVEDV